VTGARAGDVIGADLFVQPRPNRWFNNPFAASKYGPIALARSVCRTNVPRGGATCAPWNTSTFLLNISLEWAALNGVSLASFAR